jgi:cytoskeletal protein CcmA (bactofilin family)
MATPRKKHRDTVMIRRSHLCVKKDLVFDGILCVGGNLEVHGSLKVGELRCAGSITVHGDIEVGSLTTPNSVSCTGRLCATSIDVGIDELESFATESWKFWMPNGYTTRWISLVDAKTYLQLESDYEASAFQREGHYGEHLVNVGKDLICTDARVGGSIYVEGKFDVCEGVIRGFADVGELECDGDLDIHQGLDVGSCRNTPHHQRSATLDGAGARILGEFTCYGNLYGCDIEALGLTVHGDCDLWGSLQIEESLEVDGKITCEGAISAGEYIKVGGLIASKSDIKAGADYGIFAGLDVPRSEWEKRGYICASKRPINILSGTYFTRKQRFPWKQLAQERKAYFAGSNLQG